MFIAITGLHGAGKSYFANNIPVKYGFKIYNKKEIIKYLCKKKTGRDDWGQWYKEEFNRDARNLTEIILSCIDFSGDVILDAVHSDLEWGIISSIIPNSELLGVITPDFIRQQRREPGDIEKDEKRKEYWHNGGGCLMAELSWTINGGASLEFNEKTFQEFLQYIHKKELALQGGNINFTDDKTEKLRALIEQSQILDKKIECADNLLRDYKLKKETQESEEKSFEE